MTRTDVMERRTRVVELSQTGLCDDDIAAQLGYANRSGVWKARQRVLSDHQAESVEGYRAMELLRLDALQLAVWDDAMAGDPRAVAEVRNIISMRMRLLGLDSGKPDGKPAGAGLTAIGAAGAVVGRRVPPSRQTGILIPLGFGRGSRPPRPTPARVR